MATKTFNTYKQGFSHTPFLFHFDTIVSWKKNNLLTSGIEGASVFAVIFSCFFCFVKHRTSLIKTISVIELPAGINMKKNVAAV